MDSVQKNLYLTRNVLFLVYTCHGKYTTETSLAVHHHVILSILCKISVYVQNSQAELGNLLVSGRVENMRPEYMNNQKQEFITERVCNSHMVSEPAIWIGWHRQPVVICAVLLRLKGCNSFNHCCAILTCRSGTLVMLPSKVNGPVAHGSSQ